MMRKDKKINKQPPLPKNIPQTSNQTSFSNITSSILEGMSFGTGSAIGHNIVNNVSNYFKYNQPSCEEFLQKFENCKNNYGSTNSIDNCSDIINDYFKYIKL